MKNNKKLIITLSIISVLIIAIGTTYALVIGWSSSISKNSSLIVGDIYMQYEENNEIWMENAVPTNTYDEDQYFEFTIYGKNTYTDKDIWYEVVLQDGDDIGNIRIRDDLLRFRLTRVDDNGETELLNNKRYDNLVDGKRIYVDTINKNTTDEITRTYRLYMWISNDTIIGNTENVDYTIEDWEYVYASIKVNVTGDFNKKKIENSTDFKTMLLNEKTNTIIEEDNTIYISGSKADVDYNYVWYSGKLWKITAVNPDGSLKMITDDAITTISYGNDVNFYDISKKDNTSYTGSYMYQWLNEDFLDTLYNYQNIIVEDSTWNMTTSSSYSNKLLATTLIDNSTIGKNTPIGLLNTYEYYLSFKNTDYKSGYLNVDYLWCYSWWLLNSSSSSSVWYVDNYGRITANNNPSNTLSVRPSINLKSTIRFSGGSGSKDDPYHISGDKEQSTANTTLLNTRTVGEYVIFDEDGNTSTKEIYRIVGIEDGKVKLNKNDYIKNGTTTLTKKFSTSATYGNGDSDEYWDYYLNNTWYNSLASIDMLDKGTYYIKTMSSGSYKNSLCNTNNTTETTKSCTKTTSVWNSGYVGLPRYGEMFASQQGREKSGSNNVWLITLYDTSNIWFVASFGGGFYYKVSNILGARPSIYLKSNVVITGGDGTESNPFTIALPK